MSGVSGSAQTVTMPAEVQEPTPLARLQTFFALTRHLAAFHSLENKPYAIVEAATTLLPAPCGQFWEVDTPNRSVRLIACIGETVSDPFPVHQLAFGQGEAGWVAEHGQQLCLANALQDHRLEAWYQRQGLQSSLAVPITRDESTAVVAVLVLYQKAPWQLDAFAQTLLEGFAFRAGMVLRNISILRTIQTAQAVQARQAARLRTLTQLHQVISASLNLENVLQAIAQAAAVLMEAPMVSIWVADDAQQTLVVRAFSEGQLEAEHPIVSLPFGHSGIGWVAQHRQPLHIPNISTDPRFMAQAWWKPRQLPSFYGLPVESDAKLLAVLALHGQRPFQWTPDDLDLLQHFVTQAAIAFRNASLYAEAVAARDAAEAAVRLKDDILTRLLQGQLPAATRPSSVVPPMPTALPLDMADALKNAAGDTALLRELGRLFLLHVPQQMETLRAALHNREVQLAERAAHTLKGSVNTLGARTAQRLLERLERTARTGELAQMMALLPALEEEVARLTAWLAVPDWFERETTQPDNC